jgi:hypothetical protein
MLIFGDRVEHVTSGEAAERLQSKAMALRALPPGLARHSALIDLLIGGGMLLQGLSDARQAAADGADDCDPDADQLSAWLLLVAGAAIESWRSGFARHRWVPVPPQPAEKQRQLEIKEAEGYDYYAVFPEAFALAAERLVLEAPPLVVGIRSIGTSLAAMVAAALGARPPVTVRPCGDPFSRELRVSPLLERRLLDGGPHHYVIVDEGPGQSGSSLASVADWLQARGVATERIAFVPSHANLPGPQASTHHRQLWSTIQRSPGDFGEELADLLSGWLQPLLGTLDAPLQDISAGRWRELRFAAQKAWPAIDPLWERRKFLCRAGGQSWLVKFAGLGETGRRKLDRASLLAAAGLTPEPAGVVHGFLVERWHEEACSCAGGDPPLGAIAHYLGTRALLLGEVPEGASPEALWDMAVRNLTLALGEEGAAALLHPWAHRLGSLAAQSRPCLIDGATAPHEWLKLPDGRLLKSDALDHCEGHDPVGAQDLAWDVAGASVEWELGARETAWLAAEAGRAARRFVDPELLAFFQLAYLALQLGRAHSARGGATGPLEAERWNLRTAKLERRCSDPAHQQRLAATGRSIAKRNEPPGEQSLPPSVDEEEAAHRLPGS